MKYLIVLLLLLNAVLIQAKTLKIAVIDSGYYTKGNTLVLCPNESIDLTNTGMNDRYPHGQNTSHIIADRLIGKDYCIIMIKIFDPLYKTSIIDFGKAFNYAYKSNADLVNVSAGGPDSSMYEYLAIMQLLNNNVRVVAAAGNNNTDLDKNCIYYPACYSELVDVVGSMTKKHKRSIQSNYGYYVKHWEIGENVCAGGLCLSGTSMATAVRTAKIAKKMIKEEKAKQCLK